MDNQERLKARRRMRRRRRIRRLAKGLIALVFAAVIGAAVFKVAVPALDQMPDAEDKQASPKNSAAAAIGTIEKTVFGKGAVQPASQPGVYAQVDGTVKKTLVGLGDPVCKGDILMVLENDTLASERAELEYALWSAQATVTDTETYNRYRYEVKLDDKGRPMRDAPTGKYIYEQYSNELSIRSPCNGRVMAVYIEAGSDALAAYREHGSVILLSTDGRMKVELSVEPGVSLVIGETVSVIGEGVEASGTVVNLVRHGTQATIQINSDEYPMGIQVEVRSAKGLLAGTGELEINKPMAVSVYGGVIKGVTTKVGAKVERQQVLARYTLEGTPLYLGNDAVLLEYSKAMVALEAVESRMEALIITAPCDGKIASIDAAVGDAVTDGTQLLSIVEDAGMALTLSVDELDIVRVEPGQKAVMELDALSDVTLTGTVEKIAPLGNTETSVTTYDVTIALDEVDPRVLGGMNVSGEIVVETAENALIIPIDALTKGDGSYTVTLENGTVQPVETGMMTRDSVQILSGLSEGEVVVY